MSRFIIFDKNQKFKGYTKVKSEAWLFEKQRRGKGFTVKEIKNREFDNEVWDRLDKSYMELEIFEGVMILQEEFEYVSDEFYRKLHDFYEVLDAVKDLASFLKLNDQELETIGRFGHVMSAIVYALESGIVEQDSKLFTEHINSELMVKEILNLNTEKRL